MKSWQPYTLRLQLFSHTNLADMHNLLSIITHSSPFSLKRCAHEKKELSVPERNRCEYDTKRGKCKTDHNEMKLWCKRKLWQGVKQSISDVWCSNGAELYFFSFPFPTKTKVQNNTQPCWVRAGEERGKLEAIVYLETVSRSNFVRCTLTKSTALCKIIIFLTL